MRKTIQYTALLAALFLFALPAFAAPPLKVSLGPEDGSVILTVDSQSKVFDVSKVSDNQYRALLVVTEGTKLVKYTYVITVSTDGTVPTPPGPQPPVPPNPDSALTTYVRQSLANVKSKDVKVEAVQIAQAIEAVLAAANAGAITDPSDLRSTLARNTAKALGDQNNNWVAWAELLAKQIDALAPKTIQDYKSIYADIVKGLK